jgi:hypothetical protein
MNTTREWLAGARVTNDPAGDLISRMKKDPRVPGSFESIDDVRTYVRTHGESRVALAAVPVVWRRYKQWLGSR